MVAYSVVEGVEGGLALGYFIIKVKLHLLPWKIYVHWRNINNKIIINRITVLTYLWRCEVGMSGYFFCGYLWVCYITVHNVQVYIILVLAFKPVLASDNIWHSKYPDHNWSYNFEMFSGISYLLIILSGLYLISFHQSFQFAYKDTSSTLQLFFYQIVSPAAQWTTQSSIMHTSLSNAYLNCPLI